MQAQNGAPIQSRRAFLRRVALGMATLSAAALVVNQPKAGQPRGAGLPGPGSIFEPRQKDLRSHWAQKLFRLRLR
ncbi:MAG: twin-arginine translocation signal domain-containing protein [Chloroflexi bacterium]|nr:twin-arginine translocation signal domain-containing protein [Chloroflexota bacterium]